MCDPAFFQGDRVAPGVGCRSVMIGARASEQERNHVAQPRFVANARDGFEWGVLGELVEERFSRGLR